MVCVTLQELTVTSNVCSVKNYFVTEIGRYNKYRTKQCTHTSWWIVLGWVTTKEYHPCISFRNDTLHVNIELHLHLLLGSDIIGRCTVTVPFQLS